ncbi:hypothetical protein RD792_001310, partial [Penstemon davidsonii]
MASKLVSSATSEKLNEMDWTINIEICELVARDHRQAKDVIKAIKKRLGSKNSNTQLLAVMSDVPVREKIFLLLDAAQTSVGGASGRFPQYYTAYYELVSAGVKFPERPRDIPRPHSTSNVNKNNPPDKKSAAPQLDKPVPQPQAKNASESSILQKACTALEVLRDVLNTIDTQNPEGAKDEFTLDLVEQCSFQKNRVMHLAITSRDEKIISRAVELNEQLDRVLHRHDDLLAGKTMSISNHIDHAREEEEEEAEQLFRRIRKGKACVRPEDEDQHMNRPLGLMGHPIPGEIYHRPLIRPLTLERESTQPPIMEPKQKNTRPLSVELKHEPDLSKPSVAIPPPPAKHVERERFFKENKSDGIALSGHMRSLSLHSRNASSSQSG